MKNADSERWVHTLAYYLRCISSTEPHFYQATQSFFFAHTAHSLRYTRFATPALLHRLCYTGFATLASLRPLRYTCFTTLDTLASLRTLRCAPFKGLLTHFAHSLVGPLKIINMIICVHAVNAINRNKRKSRYDNSLRR